MNGYFPVCLLEKGRGDVVSRDPRVAEARRSPRLVCFGDGRTVEDAGFLQKDPALSGSQAFASQMDSAGIGAEDAAAPESSARPTMARTAGRRATRGRKGMRKNDL